MHHWGGLPHARVIETEALQLVGDAVEATLRGCGIGLILGPPGVGKSSCTDHHLGISDCAAIVVPLDGRPTDRELVGRIYAAATNERYERVKGTRLVLQHRLTEVMPETCVLHIDEAQHLGATGLKALRSVFDQFERRDIPLPTILSGGPEFAETLDEFDHDRMLGSRVVAEKQLRPLTPEDVLEAIPNYHPIYAGVDLALVLRINRVARGEFRRWAQFTLQAAAICEERRRKRIAPKIVDQVLKTFPDR